MIDKEANYYVFVWGKYLEIYISFQTSTSTSLENIKSENVSVLSHILAKGLRGFQN